MRANNISDLQGLLRRAILPVLLVFALLSAQEVQHERWPIKTSYHENGVTPKKIWLSTLRKLKSPKLEAGKKNKDYDDKLLPGAFRGFSEGDFVETTGWVHYILHEADDDYHIQVSGSSKNGNNCVIVEIPDPVNAKDADTRQHWAAARAYIDSLNNGKPAPKSGKAVKYPYFVRIQGQLFYDLSHTKNQIRGRGGMKAGTIWEIHPVWTIHKAKYH
jgi:hypothetical protein